MSPSIRRFLDNEDVVHEVFSHLSLIPSPLTNYDDAMMIMDNETEVIQRTLAAAAVTCRRWAEPASRTLWSVLPYGIFPLIRTFSCVTVKERHAPGLLGLPHYMETYYELDGEISSREWVRFTQLASRVRCLNFDHCSIEPSVVEVLTSHCERSGVALLPSLQVLRWSESRGDEPTLRFLKFLCSASTLSCLEIIAHDIRDFTDAVDKDVAVICSTAQSLMHFKSMQHLSAIHSSPIPSLRNLKTLSIAGVDLATFLVLGDLPHLSNLSTHLYSGPSHDSVTSSARKGPYKRFPRLRRFETSGNIPDLVAMITLISSPGLIALSIVMNATQSSAIISRLNQVFTLPAVKSLERIKLYIRFDMSGFRDSPRERVEVNFSDLAESLFPIASLSVVNLHVYMRAVSLSNADIARIKSTWPHLTALSVQSIDMVELLQRAWQPSGVEIIRPSICSLVDLALSRPQLEGLDVEVASITEEDVLRLEERAASVEEAFGAARDQAPRHSAQQPSLNWLTFARGEYRAHIGLPDDLERLASILVRLLPRVGGLGPPIVDEFSLQGDGTRRFYEWPPKDRPKKIFCLLEKIETLKSQPFGGSAIAFWGFPV